MNNPKIQLPGMAQLQVSAEQLMQEIGRMGHYIQHLEQNMMMMSTDLMATRAHVQMMQGMFIEKGMYTEEQIQEMYTKQVVEPIQQQIKEAQEKRQEAIDASKQQIEVQSESTPEEEEENNSDVVLPSEQHKVIKFK